MKYFYTLALVILGIGGIAGIGYAATEKGNSNNPTYQAATVSCNKSLADFRASGEIKCGHIIWDMEPRLAQMLDDNIISYFEKYDNLYNFFHTYLSFERPQGEMRVLVQCRPDSQSVGRECPNGRLDYDYPLYTYGQNIIYVSETYFERDFLFLSKTATHPLWASLTHEMGHVFTPQDTIAHAYIWDSSQVEAWADNYADFLFPMYNQVQGIAERYTWDGWCSFVGKSAPCEDAFQTVEQWLGMQTEDAFQLYINGNKTFDSFYPYPIVNDPNTTHARGHLFSAMLGKVYQQFSQRGQRQQFYDAFGKTMRFYHTSFNAPASWVNLETQLRDDQYKKVNLFIFLLSAYSRTDLTEQFQTWRFPIAKTTKDLYLTYQNQGYPEGSISSFVSQLMANDFKYLSINAIPANPSVSVDNAATKVTIRWQNPNAPGYSHVSVYRTEDPNQPAVLLATNLTVGFWDDATVVPGRTYYYEVVSVSTAGRLSPVTPRMRIAVPIPQVPVPPPPSQPLQNPVTPTQPVASNSTPLQITSYAVQNVTTNSAQLYFAVNASVRPSLYFGTDVNALIYSNIVSSSVPSGTFNMQSLLAGTKYYYKLLVTDEKNISTLVNGSFTTAGVSTPAITPPPVNAPPAPQPVAQPTPPVQPSINTNTTSVDTKPQPPQNVSFTPTGTSNSLQILWTIPNDGGVYAFTRIYRSDTKDNKGTVIAEVYNNNTHFDNRVEPLKVYYYTVVGLSLKGVESSVSTYRVSLTSDVPTVGPKDITVKQGKGITTQINWSIPEYYTSAKTVSVYRSTKKGSIGSRIASGIKARSYTDKQKLTPGIRYYYTLRVVTIRNKESVNKDQYNVILVKGK